MVNWQPSDSLDKMTDVNLSRGVVVIVSVSAIHTNICNLSVNVISNTIVANNWCSYFQLC